MKKFFLSVVANFLFIISWAATVDVETAKLVAVNFWNQGNCVEKIDADSFNNVTEQTNFSHIYIFTNAEGFVIVSGDDCARPVLAYSYSTPFDVAYIPESVRELLLSYDNQIEKAIDMKCKPYEEVASEWSDLYAGRFMQRDLRSVEPLVTAKWGQGTPYNAMCPPNTLVGCVAVAMGQLMKYWQYPVHGIGSHSYVFENISISADFENTTYNWAAMPNSCNSSNVSATATLLFHCGVAVEMEYRNNVSTAYVLDSYNHPYNCESAMKNFFGYSSSAHGEYRLDYDKSTWTAMLKEELDAGHPLIYNGYNSSNSGGHCFICDGYDQRDYFHFNWGQKGAYDGYFEIDAMTPISSQDFSYNQGAIFGLVPAVETYLNDEMSSSLAVYPNPATGYVRLAVDSYDGYSYDIYDSSSRLVSSKTITSKNQLIDLAGFSTGIYIINVVSEGNVVASQKIVVN